MAATALRPRPPRPLERFSRRDSVEALQRRLGVLVAERQRLREQGASSVALERNRLLIVREQWRLSRALVERYAAPA